MWTITKTVKKGDYLYAVVKDHPNATKHGYVLHHRIVMENHLGRLLLPSEIVHHKDENKKNNTIDNLEVMDKIEHAQHHNPTLNRLAHLTCHFCGEPFTRKWNQRPEVKKQKHGFCTRSCNGKFQRQQQIQAQAS